MHYYCFLERGQDGLSLRLKLGGLDEARFSQLVQLEHPFACRTQRRWGLSLIGR